MCVVLGALVMACGDSLAQESARTAGIVLVAEIVADGSDEAAVSVELKIASRYSNTYAELDTADRVVVVVDGEETPLSRISAGVYEGSVSLPDRLEPEIAVEMRRQRHDDALGNVGTLPLPFELVGEMYDDPVSRSEDPIEVGWEPAGSDDDMILEVSQGRCFTLERAAIDADTGSARLESGELESVDRDDPGTCEATLRVVRTRTGKVDKALDRDSIMRLRQVRSTQFISVP